MPALPRFEKLWSIVFGYAAQRTKELEGSHKCVAHYTSAETALNILRGQKIWLRNAAVMNDHSEIAHGRQCLDVGLKSPSGERLVSALDSVKPGAGAEVLQFYERCRKSVREDVFMTSLCEHDPGDPLGKLSMWRAYGGSTGGVALVFAPYVVTQTTALSLSLNASPILYGGIEALVAELDAFSIKVEENTAFLREINSSEFVASVKAAINFAMMSIKHKGFEEEEEWRLLLLPDQYPTDGIDRAVESVRGVPQIVYKIPLHEPASEERRKLTLDLKQCLRQIIIGPCLYPDTVRRAFECLLADAGFDAPGEMITVSEIPLRQFT